MDKVILSAKDLQKMGFSRSMAYRLLNRSDVPVLSIGERKFVNKDSFMEWIARNTQKTEAQLKANAK